MTSRTRSATMPSLLRERGHGAAKVSSVELFFDLVFVFAVTQLSHALLAHPSPLDLMRTAILLLSVWWAWIYTSWVTNWLEPERTPVRLLLFALMAAGLFLSMSLPQAWHERGLAFAIAYVLIQVGRSVFMLAALHRHHPTNFRNFVRIAVWLAASGVLWMAGGLAHHALRLPIWTGALVLEYLGPTLSFRVPGLGASRSRDWDIDGPHLAERCGLFIIIALGESILIIGATAAHLAWKSTMLAAFAASFLGSVAMWWIYFDLGAERASHLIAKAEDPGQIARVVYNYVHVLIVAGVIVTAAADELVLAHPVGHLEAHTAGLVLAGPALFLTGNLLFKRITGKIWQLSHLIGLVAFGVLGVVAPRLSPLTLNVATTGVLLMAAAWETPSLRDSRRRSARD